LTSGPGKLCIALGINRELNGADLLKDKIWLEDHKTFSSGEIEIGKRIGIDYAEEFAEKPWRFWLKNNSFISKNKLMR
ncbi:MAG: DNA-3-methyladenine glycosylase, partial [Actinomycetota bacterium]